MKTGARLKYGPVNLGGALGRMVQFSDGAGRLETWGGINGWEPGGTDLHGVMMAPIASPAILREYGVPEEDWSPDALREAGAEADGSRRKGR